MAQKTTVTLVDDLDESEASETVVFGLDGATFEIDLNEEHAAQMRDAFAPYVGAARRAGSGSRVPQRRRSGRPAAPDATATKGTDRERVQEVREWARANGHTVSDRGRLSAAVLQAYESANT